MKKRIMSLLLALFCLISLLPASVLQVSARPSDSAVQTSPAKRYVNPMYADIVTADTARPSAVPNRVTPTAGNSYLTEAKGAAYVRDQMEARSTHIFCYYKTSKSDISQSAADLLDTALKTHTGVPTEGDYIFFHLGSCWYSWSWYTEGGVSYVTLEIYDITYYTTAAQEAQMDRAVDQLLDQLDLWENTDYQKIKGIYDYICATVRYDYDHLYDSSYLLQYTAYAALVNKTAVCQGYANLFYRLALELDVDARIIAGTGNGGPHAWNIVELDGLYYNLDSTWDEGQSYYSWFLKSPSTFYDHQRNSEYTTASFAAEYPMASSDYVYDPIYSNLDIIKHPTNAKAYVGENVKTSIKAAGEGLSYQWYVKDPGSSTFIPSSITGTTYTFKMTEAKSGRQVYCVVSDVYGNRLRSNTVTLSKATELKITKQPVSAKAPVGSTVKATVKAAGDGLKYQWYVKNPGSSSYIKSSITGSTYYYEMTAAKSGRQVYCVITDAYGNSVKTKTVTLSKATALKVTAQPTDAKAPIGYTVKTTVKAAGDGLKYQWYVKDISDTAFVKSSVTAATYQCEMTAAKVGRQVFCVITDAYGNSIGTKVVTLNKAADLKITKQPVSAQAAIGSTVKATVKASGDGLKYQWYIKEPGSSSFVKSSITSATYSYTMTAAKSGRQVYCIITDAYGRTVKTATVTLRRK